MVSRDAVARFHDDERLVNQRRDAVENVFDLERRAGAHGFRRLERKTSREDREPTQQSLLAMIEESVAPIHRAAQRSMARQCGATSTREESERVVKSAGDLIGR